MRSHLEQVRDGLDSESDEVKLPSRRILDVERLRHWRWSRASSLPGLALQACIASLPLTKSERRRRREAAIPLGIIRQH